MARAYSSDDLIVSIRNLAGLPDAQSIGTQDSDILRHASEAILTKLLPEVMKFREEYFVLTTRIALVSGTSRYRIPKRAAGVRVRDVLWFRDNLREYIPRIDREALPSFSSSGEPAGYYLEGNHIVVYPSDNLRGSLEVSFYFAPSDLVLLSSARQVTIVISSTVLEVGSAFPATFTTAKKYDIHGQDSGAEIRNYDLSASAISGGSPFQITFTTAINGSVFGTDAVQVGDWICLSQEAVIPPLPREFHPMLARAAAMAIAESLGYNEKVQVHGAVLSDNIRALQALANSRVESRPLIITGRGSVLDLGRTW